MNTADIETLKNIDTEIVSCRNDILSLIPPDNNTVDILSYLINPISAVTIQDSTVFQSIQSPEIIEKLNIYSALCVSYLSTLDTMKDAST